MFLLLYEFKLYWKYFLFKAYLRNKIRYRNTKLGVFWNPLSLFIGTFLISILWFHIFGRGGGFKNFYIYIVSGFIFWVFISNVLSSSITSLFSKKNEINSLNNNLEHYIVETSFTYFFDIIIYLIIFIIILNILEKFNPNINFFLLLYVLIMIAIFTWGYSASMSTIVIIKNDIKYLIESIVRILFFLTPIIWHEDRLGDYAIYLWLNPFYSYLHLFRASLSVEEFKLISIILCTFISLISYVIGVLLLKKFELNIKRKSFMI